MQWPEEESRTVMCGVTALMLMALSCALLVAACAQEREPVIPSLPSDDGRVVVIQGQGSDVRPPTRKEQTPQEAFEALLERAYQGAYTITYRGTSSFNGSRSSLALTEYFSPDGYRADHAQTIDGQQMVGRTILTERAAVECIQENGQGAWTCVSFPASKTMEQEATPQGAEIGQEKEQMPMGTPDVAKLQDRQYLGLTAKCFRLTYVTETVTQDLCYTEDAILLFSRTTGPLGSNEMTATKLERSVPAGAFEPPAEPTPAEQ